MWPEPAYRSSRLWLLVILIVTLTTASHPQAGDFSGPAAKEPLTVAGKPEASSRNRIYHDLERAVARVQPFLNKYGYQAVFLAVFVEGCGLVAPGQTLLLAAALMAARGGLNLTWLLLWAFAAALAGNSLGYLLGRRGGRPLLLKLRVNESHLQRLEDSFARYGPALILVARFIDGLRQLNGIVAGMLLMPWKKFTLYNLGGAALWVGFWGLGTYLVDKEIARVHLPWRSAQPWLLGLTLVALLAGLGYLWRHGPEAKS